MPWRSVRGQKSRCRGIQGHRRAGRRARGRAGEAAVGLDDRARAYPGRSCGRHDDAARSPGSRNTPRGACRRGQQFADARRDHSPDERRLRRCGGTGPTAVFVTHSAVRAVTEPGVLVMGGQAR